MYPSQGRAVKTVYRDVPLSPYSLLRKEVQFKKGKLKEVYHQLLRKLCLMSRFAFHFSVFTVLPAELL